MRDVGERSAVHQRQRSFQRLHQVRLDRIPQQRRHRAVGLQLARRYRLLRHVVAHDDVAQTLLQVREISRQAEYCHHFRRHHDVEAILAREIR